MLVLDAMLVIVFVAGIEAAVFGLMPSGSLKAPPPVIEQAGLGTPVRLAVFAFVYTLLNPASGYLSRAPAVTALALFVGVRAVLFRVLGILPAPTPPTPLAPSHDGTEIEPPRT